MQGLSILTQNQIQIKADHLVLLLPQHADHLPTSHHTNCPPHHCEHQVIEPLHLPPAPPPPHQLYTDSMVFTQEKLGNAEHSAPMEDDWISQAKTLCTATWLSRSTCRLVTLFLRCTTSAVSHSLSVYIISFLPFIHPQKSNIHLEVIIKIGNRNILNKFHKQGATQI